MAKWRKKSAGVLLASTLVLPGCFFKKSPPKASIVIPPAPPPASPAPLPEPPVIDPSKPKTEIGEMPKLPAPASAKPAARAPRRNPAPGQAPLPAEPEPEEVPVPAPAPLPSLQPMLGTRETQERSRRIQQYLDKARAAIARAERGGPSGQQRQLIGQVRTFVQQAEEARKTDLVRAENLAERAEVLSRGLPR